MVYAELQDGCDGAFLCDVRKHDPWLFVLQQLPDPEVVVCSGLLASVVAVAIQVPVW